MKNIRTVITALLVFTPFAANADLIVNSDGKLVGATGVDVGGTLYDVVFADGTCIDVFTGCDEQSDFTFGNGADAAEASQALLDQVLVDGALGMFDSDPLLTNYCLIISARPDLSVCGITTGYGIDAPSGEVLIAFADNWDDPARDAAYDVGAVVPPAYNLGPPNTDFFAEANIWAVWSVPEPGTLALLSLGLAGMGLTRRRKKV